MSNSNPYGLQDQPGSNYYGSPQQAYQQGQQAGYSSGKDAGYKAYETQGTSTPNSMIGATGATINDPSIDTNAYQYGGQPGGAAAQNQYFQGLAGAQAAQQGAQIQNMGALNNFYGGQLNGTGPSLAAMQAQQAMQQSVAAQMAAANSARGGLAGASAQMAAANNAAGAQQAAAQQAVQGRIAEEYNAAQGMGQINYQQAALQQQQQDINARAAMGYAGLENQVNTEQMNAQMQQQAQESGNYLGASGMGMQQSQFNTTNANNMLMGGLGAAAGALAMFADADFVEPRGADSRPAWLTMREQRTVDGHPFLAIADQNTGEVEKVATERLSPAEARRVAEPHGAGPIFAQGHSRAHTTFHDMPMIQPRPVMPVQQARPAGIGGTGMPMPMPRASINGGGLRMSGPVPIASINGGGLAGAARVADMDLSAARHRVYHDAGLGDPSIQGQLANLDYGQMNAPAGIGGGGTFADQIRAQEAARIQAAMPPGGYTLAQQRYYPGAGGLGTQPQGLSSNEAARAFGGNGPAPGAIAGNAVATGGYGQGWDRPATAPKKDNGPIPANKLHQAGTDLMKSGLQRMGGTQPTAAPAQNYGGLAGSAGFQPMQIPPVNPYADVDLGGTTFPNETDRMYGLYGSARVSDMDLGDPGIMPNIPHAAYAMSPVGSRPPPGAVTAGVAGLQNHMRRLQAADVDLKSRAKLGSGARFSHLEHSLAARPGVHDAGALAAYIGRKAHGAHEMSKLAAHGRK